MVVQSRKPHYWRTAVLDRFDGFRWLEPLDQAPPALELPWLSAGNAFAAYLDWVHTARFSIDSLSSQLVVAAGTPLSVQGLGETDASDGGIVQADGEQISEGDRYSVHYYSPQPTPAEMRRASRASYRPALRRYTTLAIPTRHPGALEAQNGERVPVSAVTKPVTLPLRSPGGSRTAAGADPSILASPYASVYRLARRLTAGARHHLRRGRGDQSPAPRRLLLRREPAAAPLPAAGLPLPRPHRATASSSPGRWP